MVSGALTFLPAEMYADRYINPSIFLFFHPKYIMWEMREREGEVPHGHGSRATVRLKVKPRVLANELYVGLHRLRKTGCKLKTANT
jgi:hypothetical protein